MCQKYSEFLNSLYQHQGLHLQHQKLCPLVHPPPLSSQTEGLSVYQQNYLRRRTEVYFWDTQTTRALRKKISFEILKININYQSVLEMDLI